MPKHESSSSDAQEEDPPAKIPKTTCEFCGKTFKARGLTRHQNACKKKQDHDQAAAKKPRSCLSSILNETVFENILTFLGNQTLTKLQTITGDHYSNCDPELAKYCCSCENDNPVILHGLCRECESEMESYMPRTTKEVAKNNYGVRDKDFSLIPCEVRKRYTLFDRIALENFMIRTCGSKLEWVKYLAKKDTRKKKLHATLQRKAEEADAFLEDLAPGFAAYVRAVDFNKTDQELLEQCSMRYSMLTAALGQRGLKLRNDSRLCKDYITQGYGAIWSIVDTMEEMNFLFTHTDYAERCNRKIDDMRDEDDMLGERMWYPRPIYREMVQECRDDAKIEIRDAYLEDDEGLTLPRKWENMRSRAK